MKVPLPSGKSNWESNNTSIKRDSTSHNRLLSFLQDSLKQWSFSDKHRSGCGRSAQDIFKSKVLSSNIANGEFPLAVASILYEAMRPVRIFIASIKDTNELRIMISTAYDYEVFYIDFSTGIPNIFSELPTEYNRITDYQIYYGQSHFFDIFSLHDFPLMLIYFRFQQLLTLVWWELEEQDCDAEYYTKRLQEFTELVPCSSPQKYKLA